jgi:hypothetical protein
MSDLLGLPGWTAAHEEMLERFKLPAVQGAVAAVAGEAGYELRADVRDVFRRFHSCITDPQPHYIGKWRSDPKSEHWYHTHVDCILGSLQSGVACAFYHRDRMLQIETAALAKLGQFDYQQALGRSSVAIGNTLKWDFEYQAFVLAVRRSLEYMTRGFSAYFKDRSSNFRTWPKALERAAHHSKAGNVAASLLDAYKSLGDRFDYVISKAERQSLRDRISHYEFVGAGTINLNAKGFIFGGGGENLNPIEDGPRLVSQILYRRSEELTDCAATFIDAFIAAARIADASTSQ